MYLLVTVIKDHGEHFTSYFPYCKNEFYFCQLTDQLSPIITSDEIFVGLNKDLFDWLHLQDIAYQIHSVLVTQFLIFECIHKNGLSLMLT